MKKYIVLLSLAFFYFSQPCFADSTEEEFLSSSIQLHYLHSDYDITDDEDKVFIRVSREIIPLINLQLQYSHLPADVYAANLVYKSNANMLFFTSYSLMISSASAIPDTPSYSLGSVFRFSPKTTCNITLQYTDVPDITPDVETRDDFDALAVYLKIERVLTPKTIGQVRYYVSMQDNDEDQEIRLRINQYIFPRTALHTYYIHNVTADDYRVNAFVGNILIKILPKTVLKLGNTYQKDSEDLRSNSPKVQVSFQFNPTLGMYVSYRYYTDSADITNNNYGTGVHIKF
ncbi:MAG: hypothetical protein ABII23_03575 [bacterium]